MQPVPTSVSVSPSKIPVARPAVDADYPASADDASCRARESLRPLDPLPAPGRMPAGSSMAEIVARGRIVVGVDQNTQYFAARNHHEKDRIEGFDIDMAEAVGLALFGEPGHVAYRVITQAQRIPLLQNGEVDLVVDTMTITCDRKRQVSFSGNYYDDGQRVLVPWDSPVAGIGDLRGKRVCTVRGTTSIATLRDKGTLPYAVDNWTDCLVALQRAEVDAVSTTGALLAGLRAQDGDTKIVGPRFTDEPHGMAVRLDRADFVRFLNGTLTRMLADGTWERLARTWLSPAFDGEPQKPETAYVG
ncbi:glutamate ABC transporter substrate-binding protein [Yinghuangia aomiensis]|uniref:Glutamate ABC transporter substrate-binding protein n=1 Tax=Yinghuangia aomiensis TaxID=676205 RepID=A0ABP9H6Y6_9ACTN